MLTASGELRVPPGCPRPRIANLPSRGTAKGKEVKSWSSQVPSAGYRKRASAARCEVPGALWRCLLLDVDCRSKTKYLKHYIRAGVTMQDMALLQGWKSDGECTLFSSA